MTPLPPPNLTPWPVVQIPLPLFDALGVRLWGFPTGSFIGKMWKAPAPPVLTDDGRIDAAMWVMRIITPGREGMLQLDRALIVPTRDTLDVPQSWLDAMAQFERDWPEHADTQARFRRAAATPPPTPNTEIPCAAP